MTMDFAVSLMLVIASTAIMVMGVVFAVVLFDSVVNLALDKKVSLKTKWVAGTIMFLLASLLTALAGWGFEPWAELVIQTISH